MDTKYLYQLIICSKQQSNKNCLNNQIDQFEADRSSSSLVSVTGAYLKVSKCAGIADIEFFFQIGVNITPSEQISVMGIICI